MEKLQIGFMKDLRNREFNELYNKIIKLLSEKQLENDNIKIAFERIIPYKEKFKYALTAKGTNEYSAVNKALTPIRNNYLISLRKRIESHQRCENPVERAAAKIINDVLQKYGKKYYVATITTQSVFVNDLVDHINNQPDFKNAIHVLNMEDLMDAIIKITQEVELNVALFTASNVRSKMKREGVRKAAFVDLKVLIDNINSTYLLHRNDEEKSEIYREIVFDINTDVKNYRMRLKSRKTKQNNKRIEEAAKQLKMEQERQQQESQQASPVIEKEMESDLSASLNENPTKPFKKYTAKPHKEHASKNTIETTSPEFPTLNSSTIGSSVDYIGSSDRLKEASINSKESTTVGVNYVIDENHWRAWKPLLANSSGDSQQSK